MTWEETLRVIPEGVQTLSKRPTVHVNGVYPKYIERGEGAYVWAGENKYIDFPCSLGANLLGHCDPDVDRAVIDRVQSGTLFSLPNEMETELARMLVDYIPSFEMVRFLKTGSEACQAAVRIARAYTNKPYVICCGYHGWHEWYAYSTDKALGCVEQPIIQVPYNDSVAIENAILH
ncbi:MAG: aminotransferase class III-fold pyridoxal phosphate-dependent enzyme, partial [Candidatus Thorarchaeota archaeon]